MFIVLLVLILVLLIVCFITPTFLDEKRLTKILTNRQYLDTFSDTDLRVRNVKSVEEYIKNNIRKAVSSHSLFQKLRLFRLSLFIDLKILFSKSRPFLDPFKFARVHWKFGVVDGTDYEGGLSHTRNGVIVLSDDTLNTYTDKQLMRTLIHEKVHVYQYLYPSDVTKYIKHKHMKIHSKRTGNDRANPDTDEFIYKDASGNEYRASYVKNADEITDVKYKSGNTQYYEHPYESMAISLEKILK